MANQSQNSGGDPTRCANNCGFFGNPTTNNLCSKCYKDYIMNQTKELNQPSSMGNSLTESKQKRIEVDQNTDATAVEITAAGSSSNSSGDNNTSRQPNRCLVCKKRVGLTGFKCRCEQTFCSAHRYSDKHNCVFDYKSAGQDAIARANPVIKADKVDKI